MARTTDTGTFDRDAPNEVSPLECLGYALIVLPLLVMGGSIVFGMIVGLIAVWGVDMSWIDGMLWIKIVASFGLIFALTALLAFFLEPKS